MPESSATLTSRERVLRAVHHREADRVPIDLGGTEVSTMMVGPYKRLAQHFGIDVNPVVMPDIMQQCVIVNDRIGDLMGADAKAIFQLPKKWRRAEAYDGTLVSLPDRFRPELQPDGATILFDGDGEAELCMPSGGYFFDIVQHPLKEMVNIHDLDSAKEIIDNFDRPYWADLPWEELAKYAKNLRESTDKTIIGCFTGHIFQASQYLRGWSEFLVDLVTNKKFAEALMDRLAEAQIKAFDHYASTVGKYCDIIEVADDLGMQDRPWVSPKTYRQLIKPYHARLYDHIKRTSGLPLLMHCDGSIYSLIPDLIEIGVDILNPVQYSAGGMDLERLKREFGNDLCFWGGGIDTQEALPFWKPEEIRDQIKRNIDILAPGGGFVFGTVHNVVEGVPVENVLATFETALECGVY